MAEFLSHIRIYAGFRIYFCYIKYEKGQYKKFSAFVKNKAARLLIPYTFVATVWVVPIQCLFFGYDTQAIVNKYVLATSPSQLWFLFMLFNVFVIFWLLSDFFWKHHVVGGIAAVCLYGCGFVGGMMLPNVFMIFTALRYIPLFWVGLKLRQCGTEIIRRIPTVMWLV